MKTVANIMCVLNEAEFIEAAINSVLPGVDQLIVIDQGSTDGTQAILDRLDVTWVLSRGQNYLTRGEQFFRNLCVDLCFCDWLMITDGDEIMGDGWGKEIRAFLDQCGDIYGAIHCNYWQLLGTSAYHTLDSPLRPETGERQLFFRMNPNLRAGGPKAGTKVHTPIIGLNPPQIARLNVDCFHLGYCKTDLTARFNRNIERGDWTALKPNEEELKAEYRKSAASDPLAMLATMWPCVPLTFPKERLPASIREPRFACDYNVATRRITGRRPI